MKSLGRSMLEWLFPLGIPLPWRQLASERKRFLAALAGIAFAVTMMLFQLGLYEALFVTVVRPHRAMTADLVVVNKNYTVLAESGRFARRRLYQAMADPAVESVAPVYLGRTQWKNPETREMREIFALACRPEEPAFSFAGLEHHAAALKTPDEVLFDRRSRLEYGPIADEFNRAGEARTEAGGRSVKVKGLFEMGTTFAADGNLLMGDRAFFRLFPDYPKEAISVGLIRLKSGASVADAAARLRTSLPTDVLVVAKDEFIRIERRYWARRTPIGFVISASMIVGIVVGAIIIYQILYTDVSDHLAEYATLKGIGFSDSFFLRLILQQSLILSVCGFFPGTLMSAGLYKATQTMAYLPTELSVAKLATVFGLTVLMCSVGGWFASRKLKSANPSDLF